jgi:hypothetical protein
VLVNGHPVKGSPRRIEIAAPGASLCLPTYKDAETGQCRSVTLAEQQEVEFRTLFNMGAHWRQRKHVMRGLVSRQIMVAPQVRSCGVRTR